MDVTLHGIKNCDTVKKARQWLQLHAVDYEFRDFRETEPGTEEIAGWLQRCDWQQLLNKRSTSWKNLAQDQRDLATDAAAVANLLVANPTLIKRPLLTINNTVTVGFSDASYQTLFTN